MIRKLVKIKKLTKFEYINNKNNNYFFHWQL